MENKIIREFKGRKFSIEDIELTKEIVGTYRNLSRNELAATVCELIGWLMPNGNPKTSQGLAFLKELEKAGEITLPEKRKYTKPDAPKSKEARILNTEWINTEEIQECKGIRLEIVRPGEALKQWRAYVGQYHILGDPQVNGSRIRYTLKSDDRDLGCMLFSGASWALAPRDNWIGWTAEERKERLDLIVNQSRFLILPWVRVKNLASRALALAAKQIQGDWLAEYCYAPVLMETFVDISQYKGTCYKAANWIYLGETQGRGRNDRYWERKLTKKAIYTYALQRDFREVLKGEKGCKAVDPDEY